MEIAPSTDTPIVCSLEAGDFRERRDWIAALNREALLDARRDGLRLILTYRGDHADLVREMVRREQECCAFLGFDLQEQRDSVTLVIETPGGAADALDAIFEPFLGRSAMSGGCGCRSISGGKGDDHGCR